MKNKLNRDELKYLVAMIYKRIKDDSDSLGFTPSDEEVKACIESCLSGNSYENEMKKLFGYPGMFPTPFPTMPMYYPMQQPMMPFMGGMGGGDMQSIIRQAIDEEIQSIEDCIEKCIDSIPDTPQSVMQPMMGGMMPGMMPMMAPAPSIVIQTQPQYPQYQQPYQQYPQQYQSYQQYPQQYQQPNQYPQQQQYQAPTQNAAVSELNAMKDMLKEIDNVKEQTKQAMENQQKEYLDSIKAANEEATKQEAMNNVLQQLDSLQKDTENIINDQKEACDDKVKDLENKLNTVQKMEVDEKSPSPAQPPPPSQQQTLPTQGETIKTPVEPPKKVEILRNAEKDNDNNTEQSTFGTIQENVQKPSNQLRSDIKAKTDEKIAEFKVPSRPSSVKSNKSSSSNLSLASRDSTPRASSNMFISGGKPSNYFRPIEPPSLRHGKPDPKVGKVILAKYKQDAKQYLQELLVWEKNILDWQAYSRDNVIPWDIQEDIDEYVKNGHKKIQDLKRIVRQL